MKIKLIVDYGNGKEPDVLFTNLFVISEWERLENRRASDGRGLGISELACWAHTLLTLKGEKIPKTWREWLQQNPDLTITSEDKTDPNPTDAAIDGN